MAPNPLGRIRSPAQKAFGDTRLCGVPSERRFVFRVDSQGLHPSSFLDKGDERGKIIPRQDGGFLALLV
jgi:hypothetical protein